MYIYKQHIDDYIMCPYLFGLNVLKESGDKPKHVGQVFDKLSKSRNMSKYTTTPSKKSIVAVKEYIAEVASYEMKNDDKLSLADYRVRYTNKHYSKQTDIVGTKEIVKKLNSIFEVFATNAFLGYNMPVEIPIQGTSIIYRDIVDFILTDDESNITIVEFDDLSNFDLVQKKFRYWPHYVSPYAILAASFERPIDVIIIDPNDFVRINFRVNETAFEEFVSTDLFKLIRPMSDMPMTRNLKICQACEYCEVCV